MRKFLHFSLCMVLACSLFITHIFAAWVEVEIRIPSSFDSTPSYRLINTYDKENGIIQSDIYVSGGYGSVGMIGLYYSTELLSFAVKTDDGIVPYSGYDSGLGDYDYIKKLFSPLAYAATNKVSDLVNENAGELFFEWYTGGYITAQNKDYCIATVYFVVKDGVTEEDLTSAGQSLVTFALDVPSNTAVVGYKSGVMLTNEYNNYFRYGMNGKSFTGTTKQLAVSVEYIGLDTEPFCNTHFKANNSGVTFTALPNGTQMVTGVPAGMHPTFVKNHFFRTSDHTIEIFDKDKATVPKTITTGCIVIVTDKDGNKTEYPVIVDYDTNCDGKVTSADICKAMKLAKNNGEPFADISAYAVDTNHNDIVSAEEIQYLLAQLINN